MMSESLPPTGWRQLPRNVWMVTATSFLTDVSSEMVFNVLPLFLANVLGLRTGAIGLIEGVAESTASLLKLVSGRISDKLGQRKRLAVWGYAISALSKPWLYFATTWGWVLGVRFADRVGKGIRTAPRDALIADSIDERRRGLAFGLHRAGDTAGALVGLLLALLIVWGTQAGGLALTRLTFQRVVLASIIPALLAVGVLAWGAADVPVRRGTAVSPLHTFSRTGWRALDGRLRRFLLVVALFTLGNSADAFLVLRAQERGLSVMGVLGMVATFTFVYTLFSGPLGALSDRVGRERLIIGGWLVYGGLYLGFAGAETAVHMWLLYALYGLYYAAVEGAAKAYVADIVPPEQRGTAYGWYNAVVGVTVLPANLLAGVLWQGVGSWAGFGPAAPFWGGAVLAGTAVLLFMTWRRNG